MIKFRIEKDNSSAKVKLVLIREIKNEITLRLSKYLTDKDDKIRNRINEEEDQYYFGFTSKKPYLCVIESNEEEFKKGLKFECMQWAYMKPISSNWNEQTGIYETKKEE